MLTIHVGRGGSTVRHEEMGWGQDLADQDPPHPHFSGVYAIPGTVHFNESGLQQDNGIPVDTE